ncbi:DDE_Tnp_1_7 domain-containing protein [Nephila pilipes]|uniref:DDE_Tnp_1_7 domain-containing protein n=1 Tax=Nephila pilipes TaxID=299642 RepID=A0A8X6T3I8_NEPPI|nr:DDE_Tnp_1_7 domain-containing protein [Nephila pilipes]
MRYLPPAYIYVFPKYDPLHCAAIKKTTPTTSEYHKMTLTRFETDVLISYKRGRVLVVLFLFFFCFRFRLLCEIEDLFAKMSDSDESDLSDYFPSSSGSEMSEYDITSDEEDSDCDYSLKDAQRWVQLETKNL